MTSTVATRRDPHDDARWSTARVARLVKARSTTGDRRLAVRLAQLPESCTVLRDRQVPNTRATIDHIVVAPSGVWVIDAADYTGRVERRDATGWAAADARLFVDGRDYTKLADGLAWQTEAVRAALAAQGGDMPPVHAALCFTRCDSTWFARPFVVGDVLVTAQAELVQAIRQPGPMAPSAIDAAAGRLGRHFVAA